MSTQPRLIASLAIAFTLLSARAQDKPLFHFTEEPGPHSVGLKVVEQYDYARVYRSATDDLGKPYQGERARPLQTLIWYPAKKSSAAPMTVGDYGKLMASETSFDKPRLAHDAQDWKIGRAHV